MTTIKILIAIDCIDASRFYKVWPCFILMTSLNKYFYRDNGNKGIYNVAQNKLEKNMTLKTGTSFKNRGTLSVTSLMLLKKVNTNRLFISQVNQSRQQLKRNQTKWLKFHLPQTSLLRHFPMQLLNLQSGKIMYLMTLRNEIRSLKFKFCAAFNRTAL